MSDFQDRYRAAKADLETLISPLVEFAAQQVRKRGAFLPFGATLRPGAQVDLAAGIPDPGEDLTTSEAVLPIVVAGVAQGATDEAVQAVAVCEWVKIGVDGGAMQDAIKVQVHHRSGVAVAFYVPAIKRLLRGWDFGEMLVRSAPVLVASWPHVPAA